MKNLPKWILIGLPLVVLAGFVFYKIVLMPDGSTTLAWTAPTKNENNEPLADLAGYKIHCWAAEEKYTNTIEVEDPATRNYEIEELEPGTYICAISAVNADARRHTRRRFRSEPIVTSKLRGPFPGENHRPEVLRRFRLS